MKKGVIKIAAVLLILGSLSTTAFAAEPQSPSKVYVGSNIISPQWLHISDIVPGISTEGKTLYPQVFVAAMNMSSKITGTIYLEKYSSGKWTTVQSWSFSGTGEVAVVKSYTGTANVEYRTRVVVKINAESAEAVSNSCTI